MRLSGLLLFAGSLLSAQAAPDFDANGVYAGGVASARAAGVELGLGVPGSCDGPVLSCLLDLQKVDQQHPLRGTLRVGVGSFWSRGYVHAGPVLGHDPLHGGQGGVGLWGAFLLAPKLYAGVGAQTLWSRGAVDHQVLVSLGLKAL
jgi:hypothetical protein